MREPNSFGHRLGWPGLLALIEPEEKPSHVTPQRAVVKPEWVAKFRLDLTPADTIGHFGPELLAEVRKFFTPINGPAQAPQSESSQDKPAASSGSVETPEAGPPFKVGDTVRYIDCPETREAKLVGVERVVAGAVNGSAGVLFTTGGWDRASLLEVVPSADADGWVEHKGDKRPVPAGVFVRMKWSNGAETEATMGDIPGNGWSCGGLRITHYRVVKP